MEKENYRQHELLFNILEKRKWAQIKANNDLSLKRKEKIIEMSSQAFSYLEQEKASDVLSHVKDIILLVGQKKPVEVLKATNKFLQELHLKQYVEVNNALYLDRAKTL